MLPMPDKARRNPTFNLFQINNATNRIIKVNTFVEYFTTWFFTTSIFAKRTGVKILFKSKAFVPKQNRVIHQTFSFPK